MTPAGLYGNVGSRLGVVFRDGVASDLSCPTSAIAYKSAQHCEQDGFVVFCDSTKSIKLSGPNGCCERGCGTISYPRRA
jgi:hypothetical protein